MGFDNKKENIKKTNSYAWTFLKWYWLIIPSFYFLVIFPKMYQTDAGLLMESGDVLTLVFQICSYIMAGLMFMINQSEQSKTGVADTFLKIAAVQQFLVRNIFGMFLTVLVWYRLPYKTDTSLIDTSKKKKLSFQPKTIIFISAINLTVTIILRIITL